MAINPNELNLEYFKDNYFNLFQNLFIKEFGFFFAESRMEYFFEILKTFLQKSQYESFQDFHDYLSKTIPGKMMLKAIIDDVTIGETYFFRNEPQLEVFQEHILPEIIAFNKKTGKKKITIWSSGCSTGEEAYTLAILLMENLGYHLKKENWSIDILGTDINRDSINVAKKGIYKGNRPKRHLQRMIMDKYFDQNDEGIIQVKPFLSEMVSFAHHNLIKDPYNFPQMINPDVIFCRNVTIYFNLETTKKLIEKFYQCLRDKGYLFLGHSETLWKINTKFKSLDYAKGFVYQKNFSHYSSIEEKKDKNQFFPLFKLEESNAQTEKITTPKESSSISNLSSMSELERLMGIDSKYHEGVSLFDQKKYDESLKCFEEILSIDSNYLLAYFAIANIYCNEDHNEKAIQYLDELIQKDSLYIDAYFLKGIVLMKMNQLEESIEALKKVIYIDPDHTLAYFHLMNLYQKTQNINQCKIAMKNILLICSRENKKEIVPLTDHITYGQLETLVQSKMKVIDGEQ